MKRQKVVWCFIQLTLIAICVWIIGCDQPVCPPLSEDKKLACPAGFKPGDPIGLPYMRCTSDTYEEKTICCLYSCQEYECVDDTGAKHEQRTNECQESSVQENSRCSSDGSTCET